MLAAIAAIGAMAMVTIVFFGMAHYLLQAVDRAQSTVKEMTAQRAAGYAHGYRMGMRQVTTEWWQALSAPEHKELRNKFFEIIEETAAGQAGTGTELKDG